MKIYITDECIIYNDMPRGWVYNKNQPKWHHSLYDRWIKMWDRCKNPKSKAYKTYKNCEIDERYRYLSNYVKDVMSLENFDKLCENPSLWVIDKDIKDVDNRGYFLDKLSIISRKENVRERNNRLGNPASIKRKPVIGINIKNGKMLCFNFICQCEERGFLSSNIVNCLKGRYKSHKGYRWYYLELKNIK